jgi:exodeoxyribonuclease VII small subunit
MAKSSPSGKALPKTFEEAVAELESLVTTMESGDTALDASLANYQRGVELVKFAQEQLAAAQSKLKVLDGDMLKTLDLESDDS